MKFMIVRGVTVDGRKFRPSTWIEMIAGNFATFKNGRLKWNDHIFPGMWEFDGQVEKVLCLTDAIRYFHPEIEDFVREFVKENNLIMEE